MHDPKSSFLPFHDAVNALLEDNTPVVFKEQVSLYKALKRIVANDIVAPFDVPGYDNSGMDGYAIRHADLDQFTQFELVGSAFAGHPFDGQWQAGSCIRIMTGAAVPAGYDTVIMQEQAETSSVEGKTFVQFGAGVQPYQHVRRKGEDITTGQVLFSRGQRLKATDIGLLASIGIADLAVFKKLKVAILSTGDELCEPGNTKKPTEIYDTNRFTTAAILDNLAFDVVDLGIVPDDPETLKHTFLEALANADVVISSGGVSVGEADHTKTVLTELGQMQFWKVAIKPGKPFAYGHFHTCNEHGQAKRFFGLPGNPVSSVVTLHQLALPALRKLAGEHVSATPWQRLPLTAPIRKKPGRLEFIRATLETTDVGTRIKPLQGQGSGILSTFTSSCGYLVLDAEGSQWRENDLVTFLPFDVALS